jgi:hypothetical protein
MVPRKIASHPGGFAAEVCGGNAGGNIYYCFQKVLYKCSWRLSSGKISDGKISEQIQNIENVVVRCG